MNKNDPYNLAKLAFENKELDKLLLGHAPYKYMPKYFPGSGDSDVSSLIKDGILPYIKENKKNEVVNYLQETLYQLSTQYDGLTPISYLMICCAIQKNNKGELPENIDFEKLLLEMKKSINKYSIRLKNDFTGEGWRCEEGRYGDLKRLSKIATEKGGLNFFPEENNQDEGVKI